MKPAEVINSGEGFVTLRVTTEHPSEIREALAARDVQHVYKGDQNQAWDAVLTNHCLWRALGDNPEGVQLTFFVHDERLGTADNRLSRLYHRANLEYALTEDYYRGRSGAVWEHQDVSHGLFFTEAVSPEQFEAAGIHLHRLTDNWQTWGCLPPAATGPAELEDAAFGTALRDLGVAIPGFGAGVADAAGRLGPAVHAELLEEYFQENPAAALCYALTKTDGLYGIVPVQPGNIGLSRIPAAHPDLKRAARLLLLRAATGSMRLAATRTHRRGVKLRARELATWATGVFANNPAITVGEFQVALGHWLNTQVFPADDFGLDRSSRFVRAASRLRVDDDRRSLHYFLGLAIRCPREFTESYNEALNRMGFGLQRLKFDPLTGRQTLPFYVEVPVEGAGRSPIRYELELERVPVHRVVLRSGTAPDIILDSPRPIHGAEALLRLLETQLALGDGGPLVIGKAAAFAAELQRAPRGLGLPRQGSKYTPMVDHLIGGLRSRGVLGHNTGLLIRIGVNALDRLDAMGELRLRLPRFLAEPLGPVSTCRGIATRWRSAAAEARALLSLVGRCSFGRQVHLARLLVVNALGEDLDATAADPRVRRLLDRLRRSEGGEESGRDLDEGEQLLRTVGRDLPESAARHLDQLLQRRDQLLAARRETVGDRQRRGRASREALTAGDRERRAVETRILVLVAAYARRLWQRAESLPYVNDRPYALALYLLFGRDIFPPICRQVEFDLEYIVPRVELESGPDQAERVTDLPVCAER
jgi:hypothetical protein